LFAVDLSFDRSIHDELNCLPIVTSRTLEDVPSSGTRLSHDLKTKKRVLVFGFELRYFMEKGIIVHTVRRGMRFRCGPVFTQYITKLVDLRRACEVAAYKVGEEIIQAMMVLMTGKFLQSTKDHSDVKVCTSEKKCLRNGASHRFKDLTIINPNLTLFFMNKGTIRY
jgi:hypothetical protein